MQAISRVTVYVLICVSFQLRAQNYPVYNTYFVNPYIYNPAAAATSQGYLFVHYRQQWVNVEGAPQLSAISYNTMFDQRKAGFGAKLSNYKRGLLNTTDISFTYAYTLGIGKAGHLNFGLSGGTINNTIDASSASNPSDPALASNLINNFQPTANFGMLLQTSSGINFGIVLPQLFSPKFTAANFAVTSVSPAENILITAGYKRLVKGKVVTKKIKGVKRTIKNGERVAPLEFYVTYKYSSFGNNQLEGVVKLNVSDNFWLGAAYRQNYGIIAHTGINVKKLMIGYSFELGGQPESGFSSGTHEAFLGLKIGNPKSYKKPAPVFRSTLTTPNQPQHHARFQHQEDDPEAIKELGTKRTQKHFYVVIRAFADFAAADTYKKKLIAEKYNADVFYHEKDKKYYVHVLTTLKSSEAYEEARNLKNYTKLKEARVIEVEDK